MRNFESILIVDDDLTSLKLYETMLNASCYNRILTCTDGREVEKMLQDNLVSLVLLDINMPGKSGIEVLKQITESRPTLPVIMITGDEDLQTAVKCIKIGAYDYLTKPPNQTRLMTAVRNALEWRDLNSEISAMGSRVLNRNTLECPEAFENIVTVSNSMLSVFQYVEAVAMTHRPVLITGESGTGKELLAQAIHTISGRVGKLVTVNAAGLDDALFSDTLFGHKKGAFTDASNSRPGLVEKAMGGTLFLDEIGDLAPASQVKLLRLLQEKEYYPLGSDEPQSTDARIIAATYIDLSARLEDGRFRRDLFFRLVAHKVNLPPLRSRQEDLMLLTEMFLKEAAEELGTKVPRIPPELGGMLCRYSFPGNIRELHSLVFDALSRTTGPTLNLIPFRTLIDIPNGKNTMPSIPMTKLDYDKLTNIFGHFPTIKKITDIMFEAALDKTAGNQSLASRLLGVNQSTLSRRLSKNN